MTNVRNAAGAQLDEKNFYRGSRGSVIGVLGVENDKNLGSSLAS